MNYLYLLDTKYDCEKNRMLLYFSKDPLSVTYEFILKEKFNPYFVINLPNDLLQKLLTEFKKDLKVNSIGKDKSKVIARNFEILQKASKIISISTGKSPIVLEPERQFLINNDWGYYDAFYQVNSNVKVVKDVNLIHSAIRRYLDYLNESNEKHYIESITRRLILSNILKVKPDQNIKNDQILNILFENYFFNKDIVLKQKQKVNFENKEITIKNTINIDFTDIWPHLLQAQHYNIGYETINCDCCKPKKVFDTNTLSSSLVEVVFNKSGYYFMSKDKEWAWNYHRTHEKQENRVDYLKNNKLKEMPVGPFLSGAKELIPLYDAHQLMESGDLEITENNDNLMWFCKKNESFISEIIKKIINRQKNIEQSINLSTYANYNQNLNPKELENNSSFIIFLTEYSLLNDLLSEIPKFMSHTNTKFYDPMVSLAIRAIKKETISKIVCEDRYITNREKIITTDNKILVKINNYFPKLNLPIPKLILS